jgi:hypothetical protein
VSLFQVELGGGKAPLEVEGWAALDGMYEAAAKQSEEHFKAHLDMASSFREALATAAGRRMLEHLMRTYFMQRIVRPGDDDHSPGIRQGQQDVVRFMISMVEFANSGGGRQTGPGANPSGAPP